jgi:hypothetical protein
MMSHKVREAMTATLQIKFQKRRPEEEMNANLKMKALGALLAILCSGIVVPPAWS